MLTSLFIKVQFSKLERFLALRHKRKFTVGNSGGEQSSSSDIDHNNGVSEKLSQQLATIASIQGVSPSYEAGSKYLKGLRLIKSHLNDTSVLEKLTIGVQDNESHSNKQDESNPEGLLSRDSNLADRVAADRQNLMPVKTKGSPPYQGQRKKPRIETSLINDRSIDQLPGTEKYKLDLDSDSSP